MNRPPHWEHVLLPPPEPQPEPPATAGPRPGWLRRLRNRLTHRKSRP